MEENEYLSIKEKIEKGEIVPFYILKNYINYKLENNIDVEKLLEFYRINDSISYNYLMNFDEKNKYHIFLEKFNQLKYSLSETNLKNISNKLNSNDYEQQKEFILSEPNKMFLKIFNGIKGIIELNKNKNKKRGEIYDLINKWYRIYSSVNEAVLFPTLISSKNYSYNKLLYDYIYCLIHFLKKRKFEKNNNCKEKNYNESVEDKKNSEKEINISKIQPKVKFQTQIHEKKNIKNKTLLNKKRKKSKDYGKEDDKSKAQNQYEMYDNDEEFIDSFINLIDFLSLFEQVFKFIDENKNDEENMKRIEIVLFYLTSYEEARKPCNKIVLKYISNILITSTINEKILNKCKIYRNNKIITQQEWKSLKFDKKVDLEIDGKILKNIRIKCFNNKLLELNEIYLKNKIENYDADYLSIDGLRMKSIIYEIPGIDDIFKKNIYSLVCSNIIKEGFQKYDTRFNHTKQIYPFQGLFKKEIFDEIWDNIIFVPFIYQNSCSRSERSDYKIFLNSNPNDGVKDNPNVINIIFSKLVDLFHEIFHTISILYATSINEYEGDSYSTSSSLSDTEFEEFKGIITDYGNQYPNQMKSDYEKSDMGDIMEIYLLGAKLRTKSLYSSVYFLNILDNSLNESKINDIRQKFIDLTNSKEEINMEEFKKYCEENNSDKKNQLYDYFKNSIAYKICVKTFSNINIINNIKYEDRKISYINNIITNINYTENRKPCSHRRYRKQKK